MANLDGRIGRIEFGPRNTVAVCGVCWGQPCHCRTPGFYIDYPSQRSPLPTVHETRTVEFPERRIPIPGQGCILAENLTQVALREQFTGGTSRYAAVQDEA